MNERLERVNDANKLYQMNMANCKSMIEVPKLKYFVCLIIMASLIIFIFWNNPTHNDMHQLERRMLNRLRKVNNRLSKVEADNSALVNPRKDPPPPLPPNHECFGTGNKDPNVCSGHGNCTGANECTCDEDGCFIGVECEIDHFSDFDCAPVKGLLGIICEIEKANCIARLKLNTHQSKRMMSGEPLTISKKLRRELQAHFNQ